MNSEAGRQAGAPGTGWFIWALAVVPAMFIIPMYVFPLPFPPRVAGYGGRRILECLWAAGLILALLWPSTRSAAARIWVALSPWSRWAAGVFVGGGLLSAFLSSAPAYALREWSLITLLLVATLPLAAVIGARRTRALEAVALTLVLYAILVGVSPLRHGFAHPRFLGQALAVIAPAVLFSGNLTLALISAPAVAIGILNGSRALMLTLVVVTVAALLLWPDRRKRLVPGVVALTSATLLVGGFALLGADSSLQAAVERGVSGTGRGAMWLDAFERFIRAPLLGEGPGLLARAPGVARWAGHPHNSVLLIAAEMGMVGLASVAVLVARGLIGIPRLAADRRPWALALIGGGFHSLFSGTTVMPASQAMLVLALALVLPAPGKADAGKHAGRAAMWIMAGLGAAAVAILVATFFLPTIGHAPRFFQRGIIP